MANLLATRIGTKQLDYPAIPNKLAYPVAAGVKLYAGLIGALNAAGFLDYPAAGSTFAAGVIDKDVDNTNGTAGAVTCDLRRGCFLFDQGAGTAITIADRFKDCYLSDNHSVSIADQSKGFGGVIYDVDASGIWVRLGKV